MDYDQLKRLRMTVFTWKTSHNVNHSVGTVYGWACDEDAVEKECNFPGVLEIHTLSLNQNSKDTFKFFVAIF